jgi:hypothetical protein
MSAKQTKVNYQNGKIYKLRNKVNEKFYIGSTTASFANRKSKFCSKTKREPSCKLSKELLKLGWKDDLDQQLWYMELVQNYPYSSKKELEKREGTISSSILSQSPILS